jgi:hypothetical protein
MPDEVSGRKTRSGFKGILTVIGPIDCIVSGREVGMLGETARSFTATKGSESESVPIPELGRRRRSHIP